MKKNIYAVLADKHFGCKVYRILGAAGKFEKPVRNSDRSGTRKFVMNIAADESESSYESGFDGIFDCQAV